MQQRVLLMLVVAALSAAVSAEVGEEGPAPLYPILENGYWGLIEPSGKVVLPARFEKIGRWPTGFNPAGYAPAVMAHTDIEAAEPTFDTVIPVRLNGQAALAKRDGQVLAAGRYEDFYGSFREGRIAVRAAGRWGFADERGELVVPARYGEVERFEAGYAFVESGGRWGIIDRDGKTIVGPTWDQVDTFPGDRWVNVRVGDRWGAVDRSGKVIFAIKYEYVSRPLPPLTFVIESGQPKYLRPDGTTAFQLRCPKGKARGFPFFENNAAIVRCGEREGLIDTAGNFLLKPDWDMINPFYDRRAIVIDSGKKGLIDTSGRFILQPGKRGVGSYDEGLAYFEGPGGKFGFLDVDGNVAIPAVFDSVGAFADGLCPVGVGGKTGYIDRSGAWVIRPKFCLAGGFRGPLATATRPLSDDSIELAYIDRSGKVVFRMRFQGIRTMQGRVAECAF